jgi:hypothetical protein
LITKEAWRAKQVRLLIQPLDLENLVRKGILEKNRAWYRILKLRAIPEHVWAQVCQIAPAPNGTGSMIKFAKLSKQGRADFEKLLGMRSKS